MVKTGDIFDNRYVVVYELNAGGFAHVWCCIDTKHMRLVAVKIFNDPSVGKLELKLLNEVDKHKCSHLNTLINVFETDTINIVENLYACSIYSLLGTNQYSNGLPLKMVLNVTKQILHGLCHLHNKCKMVHGDVKPENIFIKGKTPISRSTLELIQGIPKNKPNELSEFIKPFYMYKEDEPEISVSYDEESYTSVSSNETECMSESDVESDGSDVYPIDLEEEVNNSHHKKIVEIDKLIDIKYLENVKIRLGDFGSCYPIHSKIVGDVQTRYYRPPEVILRIYYNQKIDIWALGCSMCELLTGKILFDPRKSKGKTCDRQQLYDIQCMFGKFPMCYEKSRKWNTLFDEDGIVSGYDSLKIMNFESYIYDNVKQSYDANELRLFISLLKRMLTIDFHKRPTAGQCLKMLQQYS